MSARDELLYEIYSASVEEFTSTRNRIAKATDDPALAKEIKGLKKPTLSAWVVNQLARERSSDVRELVDLPERLSESSGPKELRAISDERRKLIAKLTDHAAQILQRSGHSASSTTLLRASQTLLAASSGEDLEALATGTLSRDLESPGFGALSGFELAGDSEPYSGETNKARERAEELDAKAKEAEQEAADARRVAEAAERDARKLAKEAETAAKRAELARKRADEALRRLN